MWFAAATPPDGFIECNGQSTAAYPALAAISGAFVPDLRGQFISGWDHGKGIDIGRVFANTQIDAYQGHHHTTMQNITAAWEQNSGADILLYTTAGPTLNSSFVGDSISDGIHGIPRVASETRPTNVSLLPCIKY